MSERTDLLTGNQLKLIACAAMFCDHAAKALGIHGAAKILMAQVIGRIAFPIFCFFIAEGFFHTRDRRKYLFRMLFFAAVSEIPFNLTIFHAFWHPRYQNTLFSLSLGLILFLCLSKVASYPDMPAVRAWILKGLLIAGFATAAHYLRIDYKARGLLVMALFYFLHDRRPLSLAGLWSGVILNLNGIQNPAALLAAVPLHFYNGKRGKLKLKYFFYIFYPLHLLLLYAIRRLVL